MAISATALRADLYRIFDRLIESGEPIEIERRGSIIRVTLQNLAE